MRSCQRFLHSLGTIPVPDTVLGMKKMKMKFIYDFQDRDFTTRCVTLYNTEQMLRCMEERTNNYGKVSGPHGGGGH